MLNKLKPLGNRILAKIENSNVENKTESGLYIPDSVESDKLHQAKVLAVGPGIYNMMGTLIPMQVKAGDTIYFRPYSGTEAGDNLLIMREDDVLGVIHSN